MANKVRLDPFKPNKEHLALLKRGVDAWNSWRRTRYDGEPPVDSIMASKFPYRNREEIISWMDLHEDDNDIADRQFIERLYPRLPKGEVFHPSLEEAYLAKSYLSEANLSRANLRRADLRGADLRGADLSGADLSNADLFRANLVGAKLGGADLSFASFEEANLSEAILYRTDLNHADLRGANLSGAKLLHANLTNVNLTKANLTGCHIYGVSAWGLILDQTEQNNLIITNWDEPEITVDNIEVAQFIYLILRNEKIRDVIDTITSKAVLILGRFTEERKAVLKAMREELRKRSYLPILFDFEAPSNRNTDETITLLARMARFVIADISDAKSVLQELRTIVPNLPNLPVQPIIAAIQEEPGMFDFYRHFPWFLQVYRYSSQSQLLTAIGEQVIGPAERKIQELRGSE